MYRIVRLGSQWVVCVGPAMLLAFDRMDTAIRTIHDSEKLLSASHTPAPAPPPGHAVRLAEAARRHPDTAPEIQTAPAFVERRRTVRTSQPVESDEATPVRALHQS